MSIKHKIAGLATLWLVGILIVVNLSIYFAFIHITTDNERDNLINRAASLLKKVQFSEVVQGKNMDVFQSFLLENNMIRLLDGTGHTLQELHGDDRLTAIETKSVQSDESELYQLRGVKVLVARVPVHVGDQLVGTLEIAEKLDSLAENIAILISILMLTSLGAIGMSVIGGLWLSKWILRPITSMVKTMEDIEKSLVIHKIPMQNSGKDELYSMVSTFNRMMDRLQVSFYRQQQFVYDASHELKTPLTIIVGYARMLQRWGLQDAEKGREAVANIYTEAERMKHLTQQLLDLASLEQEQQLKFEQIDFVSFSKNTAALLHDSYQREVIVQNTVDTILCRADAAKMKQLLVILLDNAIKYSNDEITILLTEEKSMNGELDGIEIRIRDRGIGIPLEELPRVFERFYRVDSSRFRKTGGTGLGLSIASEIVKLHNGTIDIQSAKHVGTEVIVFLPLL
ncbi:HAMP domain-containing histidine kinase [Paenibacillus sp. N3.4]|uniref:HAMP domain-containing sensor histidine kinase n=1 Tax=Paenibacillus sp. N3.4 TaxID=2603222 RepID=UPI0011C949F9|nr:HAMP domain-containing histidine kinase [Paenibacillus sp. N3.4]TXK74022.1 HAMP domain-containing histidine kinase [Paenibacillus sp. N3.4]